MSDKHIRSEAVRERIESGEIANQKIWEFIEELNSKSDELLDAPALTDGKRTFSYRRMFKKWEQYAEVFSALDITEKNKSRVGFISIASIEAAMIFYGLNMTGASISMFTFMGTSDEEMFAKMVEKEGITDLILCDLTLQPEQLHMFLKRKKELGLRNIIVQHVRIPDSVNPMMNMMSRMKYQQLREFPGVKFMGDLLKKYEATPIVYSSGKNREDAVIMHTSGTTSGIHKPVPLSDHGFNEAAARLLRDEHFKSLDTDLVSALGMDLSAAYSLIDMLHLPLAMGGKVVTMPLTLQFSPEFAQMIKQYDINVLFCAPLQIDAWMRAPVLPDLSGLEFVFVGGNYVSAEARKRYNDYLKKCGAGIGISVGYGLTEVGGACVLSSPECTDDSIGYPLPGVKVKIFDEDEEKYYDISDGPHIGGLCIASPSVSKGRFNGTTFFKLEKVDGEQYLNTYDLVKVSEEGSLTFIGRMNKFFVNNEGIRFDAGLVENAIAAQPGIISCGLAPIYMKLIHDTTPVLYVEVDGKGPAAVNIVQKALVNVYVNEGRIKETNLPSQCVITDDIPLTATGKVDVYQITKNDVKGMHYNVKPVRRQDTLVGVKLLPAKKRQGPGAWGGVPDELEKDMEKFMGSVAGVQGLGGMSFGPMRQMQQNSNGGQQMPPQFMNQGGSQMLFQMLNGIFGNGCQGCPRQGFGCQGGPQGFGCQGGQGGPQGFGCQGGPQGFGCQGGPQQGADDIDDDENEQGGQGGPQGFGCRGGQGGPQGFGCQGGQQGPQQDDADEDADTQDGQANAGPGGAAAGFMTSGPIAEILRCAFGASDIDYFYED